MNVVKKAIGGLLTVVALGLAGLLIVPTILGLDRYVITTGSMTGTYDTGSVVFTENVPVSELRVGDVITYAPPPGEAATELVTHRIASIDTVDGEQVFRTKGDANETVDPWKFQLEDTTQARVVESVPYVGYGLMALQDRQTRMLVIGVPALLVAVLSLIGVFRNRRVDAGVPELPHAAPLEVRQ
jgi:signal peptidase I